MGLEHSPFLCVCGGGGGGGGRYPDSQATSCWHQIYECFYLFSPIVYNYYNPYEPNRMLVLQIVKYPVKHTGRKSKMSITVQNVITVFFQNMARALIIFKWLSDQALN